MGVFDKLKNALFEVEYVEEEIPEKKEKKKNKEKNVDLTEDKPIAKKIVLPGKKEEKVEEIQEEDLMDEDFEIRPKEQVVAEKPNDTFKFMDDDDFKMDDDPVIVESIPQPTIVSTYTPPVEVKEKPNPQSSLRENLISSNTSAFDNNYVREYDSYKEKVKDNEYTVKPRESKPYGLDPSNQISIKKYGSYDNRDEKTYFKPSPIISPIYGILDKNYKKEDVVPKKTVRISTYSRNNVNVDDVRNKAFADKVSSIEMPEVVADSSLDVEENENLLVDLSNEREKPEVKEITVGDAMEYFDDLGLEYNVDYVDVSNKKKKNSDLSDDIKMEMEPQIEPDELVPKMIEEDKPTLIPVLDKTPVVEVKNESNEEVEDDDDNLFDLIDSMYKEN